MLIRGEMVSTYLTRAVRQMTADCPTYGFTNSTVPATGPRRAKGTLQSAPCSNSSSSVIEAYRECLEGHGGHSFAR
jgi:hypothetical protein